MGRHNGNKHAETEAHRLRHQPTPPSLDGQRLMGGDRVTLPGAYTRTGGRVLWLEWRDADGLYVDPTGRPGRDRRNGQWHALVEPDGAVSRLVPVASLTRENVR